MITGIWGILQNKLFLSSALFLFVCYQAIRDWKDFVVVLWLDGNLSCICAAYFRNRMSEELMHNLRIFWLKREVLSQESCLLSLLDTNQFVKDEVKMKWLVDVRALMVCLEC